jgi:hypothetical protein
MKTAVIEEHEKKCIYQLFKCEKCDKEVRIIDLEKHIRTSHPDPIEHPEPEMENPDAIQVVVEDESTPLLDNQETK